MAKKAKVLIVNNYLLARETAKEFLEMHGDYAVTVCASVDVELMCLKHTFDVAMVYALDIECSGAQVADRIQSLGIPVVGIRTLPSHPKFGDITLSLDCSGQEVLSAIATLAEEPAEEK